MFIDDKAKQITVPVQISKSFNLLMSTVNRRKDIVELTLPLALLLGTFVIGSFGPFWTFLSLSFIPISINLTSKYFQIKDSSIFYFSFTICSILLSYLVFEIITVATFASITRQEYLINLIFLALTIYSIQKTRMMSTSSQTLISPPPLKTHSSPGGSVINNYNYCKKCTKTIPGRDHHCIWLNTCIGRSNRYWFLATLFFAAVWLLVTVLVNLTSICYPVYLFGGNSSGGESPGGGLSSRWFLVPFQCPDVYHSSSNVATISFVFSMYGLGVLFLLILILIHQMRLLYKGVSYLEYKYGKIHQPSGRTS